MVDVFEEVEEQLRTERYMAMAKRSLPWVLTIGAAVIVVGGGLWGWTAWQDQVRAKASTALFQAMEAQQQRDPGKATTLLAETAKSSSPGYKTLALFQQGGMRLEAGDTAAAVKFFDEAAKAAPDPLLEDLARLRSIYALMDTAPYADLEKRITPLTGDKRPYRMLAKEALAFLKLRDGKIKEARTDFVVLSQIFDAPPGMRERARQAVQQIDRGGAEVVVKAAKQAVESPPPPQMGIPGLPPGMTLPGPEGAPQ
ncbi:MAG TPA: tetratricopeptide repeat protein [Caulobacter sp.]|nr:tetratricopeptide repeat protein [Caulobacter sp.]